jgi:hypothetical protein
LLLQSDDPRHVPEPVELMLISRIETAGLEHTFPNGVPNILVFFIPNERKPDHEEVDDD